MGKSPLLALFFAGAAAGCTTLSPSALPPDQACLAAAAEASQGGHVEPEWWQICGVAIARVPQSSPRRAHLYLGRGVIALAQGDYGGAIEDFSEAIAEEPGLGEAYVDRGAALIAARRYQEGVAEISRGLALNPASPEKAYYDRAVGYEFLGRIRDAYFDYKRAATLKPDWALPREELTRFKVLRRPKAVGQQTQDIMTKIV